MDEEELHIHERRLKHLRLQAATRGINTPPEVLMEIEDIQNKIIDMINVSDKVDGLKLVDVRIIQTKEEIKSFRDTWLSEKRKSKKDVGLFPIIEIKLRNISNNPMFLKRVTFNTKIESGIEDDAFHSARGVSWEYSLVLNENINQQDLYISQFIEQKGVDRFIVVLASESSRYRLINYSVTMQLHYNETSSIDLGTYLVQIIPLIWFVRGNSIGVKKVTTRRLTNIKKIDTA